MKVLITGHDGYIGCLMTTVFKQAGHEVFGLDSGLFSECGLGPPPDGAPNVQSDVRDVIPEALRGYDAVVHLAAVSNDPMGDLDPAATESINHGGTVSLARAAVKAEVPRFLFASSCSLYGAASTESLLDESAPFNPVTVYGKSKVKAEHDLASLASDDFSPTFLRNATVYGFTPRVRGDLAVNNLAGFAFTTGEVLLTSDGSPWRPMLHVEDFCRAFLAASEAPRNLIHSEAFNVGRNEENYQIRDIAEIVREQMPGTKVRVAPGAGPDKRSYRVDFSKLHDTFPDLKMEWTVPAGVLELMSAYERHGLTLEGFESHRLIRLEQLKRLREQGRIDQDLRWM